MKDHIYDMLQFIAHQENKTKTKLQYCLLLLYATSASHNRVIVLDIGKVYQIIFYYYFLLQHNH
jgi:hypothetical protein